MSKAKLFYPCYYDNLKLNDPQNVWVDGRFYEWIDKYGNVEVARMKLDAYDHFFPNTEKIKEENVIGFRILEVEQ